LEQLSGVFKAGPAHDWLFSPNPLLDHHKPVDLLREGEYRRVLGAIDALAEGVFV
ncbi:MAG: MbcA/ParS/Xre antitoxin family protein, partial [Actinomycetota bacterium]|nr:MbcA/ParS/Xre antitoxin family protein [Actinomycetota bacterium]